MNPETVPTGERLEEFALDVITLEHLHRYALATEFTANKKVLDIACGEGYGAHLLSAGAAFVTGIDIDPGTIQKAKKKYTRSNLEFITGNVESIPLPDATFDVVTSFETLEHLVEHDRMLTELKRVLRPGGLLVISTPDKLHYSDNPGYKNPFHQRELYRNEFEDLIQRFFNNSLFLYQQSGLLSVLLPQVPEGNPVSYQGNFDHLVKEPGFGAPFLIAIASDKALPPVSTSLFRSTNLLPLLLADQREAIQQTMSYRLGHTLLKPLKFFRSLFSKRKPG